MSNKEVKNSDIEGVAKTVVNWDMVSYAKPHSNHWKIKISLFNHLSQFDKK